jgi:hypothetical protein
MATTGCGISHKDMNKTYRKMQQQQKNKNNTITKRRNHKQISFQNTVNISQKNVDKIYTYTRSTQQNVGNKLLHIL